MTERPPHPVWHKPVGRGRVRGRRAVAVALAGLMALGGCADLWPPPGGGGTTAGGASAATPAGAVMAAEAPSGTAVGAKVADLGAELQTLRTRIATHNEDLQHIRGQLVSAAERYHGTVAAMNARLQLGTPPRNPVLLEQHAAARRDLDAMGTSVAALQRLAEAVAVDARTASDLSDRARATFALPGAVEADHRQLAVLQDETDRSAVLVNRLLTDIGQDIRRQNAFLAAEPAQLAALASAIDAGEISGRSFASTGDASVAERPALVVIRFHDDDVAYEEAVRDAVSAVLDRDPNARFDVVAVAPDRGDPALLASESTRAQRHASDVERTLWAFGLPPSRIRTAARVSPSATTSEVRLYVR